MSLIPKNIPITMFDHERTLKIVHFHIEPYSFRMQDTVHWMSWAPSEMWASSCKLIIDSLYTNKEIN